MEENDAEYTGSASCEFEIRVAALQAQSAFLVDQIVAAYPSQTCLELSGLKRRCGLTTSIVQAVAKLVKQTPSMTILVVCSGQAPATLMKFQLTQINEKIGAAVKILPASFVEKRLKQRGGWNKQFDLVIVDDFKFICFAKDLQSNAKTLVLCQTGTPPDK